VIATFRLYKTEDGGTNRLRNFGNLSPGDTMSHPRRIDSLRITAVRTWYLTWQKSSGMWCCVVWRNFYGSFGGTYYLFLQGKFCDSARRRIPADDNFHLSLLLNKNQQDDFSFIIYFSNHPLRVSNRLTIRHQEVLYCIRCIWYYASTLTCC
jgi:hypothetical protein